MKIDSYSDLNIEDDTLRPYQQKAKKDIFEAWDEVDSVMFQMPTGTGKTRLFTSIIHDINENSLRSNEPVKILVVAHRAELIDQIDASLKKYRVAHNVIAGGREKNYKYPVSVASIQTITNARNLEEVKKLEVQFVIIDEAHHALAKTYKKLWDLYPNAKFLGVTATPWRMNHQSFKDLFDRLVLSMSIKDFIKQGYLSPYKYFSLKSDSDIQRTIDDIELDRFGEYKEDSMEEKMDIGSIRAQLLDSYLKLAEGKKGIIYAINIVHARHICEEYQKAGYNAVSIDSKTPAAERQELVKNFKRGEIDIIVNVDIFSEGFDCPDIEFIQLARPTRSLAKYLQQVGRGLRITEDKQHCIILDNVGMYSRFGVPNARRHWKHHFLGKKVDESPSIGGFGVGWGGRREVDMSEGTEDMELIQDAEDVKNAPEELDEDVIDEQIEDANDQKEVFSPRVILEKYNFTTDNFVFFFDKSKRIFETYIQDDKYYIISELIIDETNHCVHRKRVGKISDESWMFLQFLRGKVNHLAPITHYGGIYSVFHYYLAEEDKSQDDRYYDYKGREINSPTEVLEKYESAKKEGEVDSFIDRPVSKATFKLVRDTDSFSVYRTLKGITALIAKFPNTSQFGLTFDHDLELENIERKSKNLPEKKFNSTDHLEVVKSDKKSFTIRKLVKGEGYLEQYDLSGNLLYSTSSDCGLLDMNKIILIDDWKKLCHTFDNVTTSYKFFWFMSLLQIYRETQDEKITFKQILVRMAANAWNYIYIYGGYYRPADQLPKYVREIKSLIKLKVKGRMNALEVEEKIKSHPKYGMICSLLEPLLNNVPYRFLSPWISYKGNNYVIEKSRDSETKGLYALYDDYILINESWGRFMIDSYELMSDFVEMKLASYLGIESRTLKNEEFKKTTFDSLSQFVRALNSNRDMEIVSRFVEKYNLPLEEDLTPRDILNRIPESKYTLGEDGRKFINVPKGIWSLDVADKLMSGI